MDLRLHPKQGEALLSPATEILYGGAAGGGKSHLLRVAAIAFSHAIQGLQTYLFRRTHPDLLKNHMEGPTSFPALLAPWVQDRYARINYSDNVISIGASRIHLCHCQYAKDVHKYLGAEIHMLLMDELTLFEAPMYRYLRSRVRMSDELKIPKEYRGQFPRIIAGSNPGNVGHNWVKAMWVEPAPPMEVWRAAKADGGMLRQFIPARLEDNPSITDPNEYADKLSGLGDPALVRAMRSGDWDIVAGGAVDDLWSEEVHVLAPFEIPSSWTIFRALDWGTSKPFSVGWWAKSDGTEAKLSNGKSKSWPRGSMFRIQEWYGWNGQPNEGCRMIAAEAARGIREREANGLRGRVADGPADSSIFDTDEADSIADRFARAGVRWEKSDKTPGSRKAGLDMVREMLAEARKDYPEGPCIYTFNTCRNGFIRTFPCLPRDPDKPDDVDTDAEDHAWDETRYAILHKRRSMGTARVPIFG